MSEPAPIVPSISEPGIYANRSAIPARKTESQELVAVALFSGIGLFVSLVAVILGIEGVWF